MPIYVPVIISLLGGLLLPLFRFRSRRARSVYVELITLATSVCVGVILARHGADTLVLLRMTDEFTLALKVDGLSMVFMGLIGFLWPLATLYAFEYMAHEERENAFFTFYTLSYAVTLLVAMSANLFTMYVFYECLTLVTLPLVTHKKDASSIYAGRKYLCYSIGGAALGFIGLIFLSWFGGTTSFSLGGVLNPALIAGHEDTLRLVFVIAFVGFSAKAAIFPLQAWLPLASVAPTPVTALLHAVAVVKTGAFAAIRLTYYSFGTAFLSGTWAQTAVLILTAFTILYGSVMAVKEQHLKRRLAYSTVSNLNYVLFAAALMTQAGMVGAMTHLVFHGIMKITLFYCAGAILIKTGREYVQDIRGFYRVMPFTTVIFTIAGLALTGVPPLAGFISKWNIITAASDVGGLGATCGMVALILSAVLTAVYLVYPSATMLFMPLDASNAPLAMKKADPSLLMELPLVILTIAIIALGMFSVPLVEFFTNVAMGLV